MCQSSTCDLPMLMMANTIGMTILRNELRSASYIFVYSGGKENWRNGIHSVNECSDSLAFIQGTGLEILMSYYHLEYDPDKVRNTFFSLFHQHGYIS